MKTSGLILLLLSFNWAVQAQDKISAYGKIDKADLEMRDCSFDPGAEAVVLLDIGEIEFRYIANTGWVSESRDRKSTRLNSSHPRLSRMPSSA